MPKVSRVMDSSMLVAVASYDSLNVHRDNNVPEAGNKWQSDARQRSRVQAKVQEFRQWSEVRSNHIDRSNRYNICNASGDDSTAGRQARSLMANTAR